MSKDLATHRSGMLLPNEQLETRGPEGQNLPAVSPELIMEFCRALIGNTHSSDVIYLSAVAARHKTRSTQLEMHDLLKLVFMEKGMS